MKAEFAFKFGRLKNIKKRLPNGRVNITGFRGIHFFARHASRVSINVYYIPLRFYVRSFFAQSVPINEIRNDLNISAPLHHRFAVRLYGFSITERRLTVDFSKPTKLSRATIVRGRRRGEAETSTFRPRTDVRSKRRVNNAHTLYVRATRRLFHRTEKPLPVLSHLPGRPDVFGR